MTIKVKSYYLEKIYEGKAVSGKPKYSNDVITKFKKTILKLQFADNIRQIKRFKGLNFEALKEDWKGYYSVRVDYHYRLILSIEEDETIALEEVLVIEDLTNHYQ